MKRRFAWAAAALPLTLIAAIFGGWATITVETLPARLTVGQPTNITFGVRQHGHNLLPQLSPLLEARNGDERIRARAVETNRPGFYTATLTPPTAGNWEVTIRSGFGRSDLTLLPIKAASNTQAVATLSEIDFGKQLFVAKGCATCHTHAQAKASMHIDVGPNLTSTQLPRKYLRQFLADPSVKKNWSSAARMPNLELKTGEIDALIAFVKASRRRL